MKRGNSIKNYIRFIFFLFCVVVILIGQSFLGESIKYPFSYVFNPIYVFSTNIGTKASNWKNALINAASYIEEYAQIKEENTNLKAENTQRLIDYEEYISLKENSSIVTLEKKYLESKVLTCSKNGELLINSGKKDGVQNGDVVLIGKIFIGTVIDVGTNSSLVKLPLNNSSSFEVVVIPSNIDLNEQNRVDSLIKSTGVVIGNVDNIQIENMGINSLVSDGDTILIRDERVGDILVLGTLVGVSKNPASTYKSGYVSPILDYCNILTVFVNIK